MCFCSYLLQVQVICELHVLGVYSKNLHSAHSIRNSNINLSIEPSKSSESSINRVWSVGCSHYNHMRPLLQPIHQGQQLTNNPPLNFSICFLPLWCYAVKFINEDDSWRILLCLLKCFSQI